MKRFIGDAVMTAPLLDAVEKHYSPLSIICAAPVAQVLENPNQERNFLPIDTRRKPWEVVAAARELRRKRFDIAILVNQSFRSAITIRLAGIKRRIGHAAEGRNWMLTDVVPYSEADYEAWSQLDLAKPLGIDAPKVIPSLPVRDSERDFGFKALSGATVGIQPGATFASKMLPSETLREVCNLLTEKGYRIVLLGAKAELDPANALAETLKVAPINLVGKTTIRESLGVLTHLKVILGADTGLMHMAAAVGTPTVTIFGPTPADKWGHLDRRHRVLVSPDGDMSRVPASDVSSALQEVLAKE